MLHYLQAHWSCLPGEICCKMLNMLPSAIRDVQQLSPTMPTHHAGVPRLDDGTMHSLDLPHLDASSVTKTTILQLVHQEVVGDDDCLCGHA